MKYKHIKTGNIYWFESYGMMKVNGSWESCVIYSDGNGDMYVREQKKFESKFEKVNK